MLHPKQKLPRSLATTLLVLHLFGGAEAGDTHWPQFRGPTGEGTTLSKNLPLRWSETENVRWRTAIPGTGWSSPVIWGKQAWMATATDDGRSLRAIAVDTESGRLLHNVELFSVPAPEAIHKLNSHASPTPVIEAGRVYFFFGMYGAAALDTATGKVVWKNTDLPHDHGKNGPGSSPILHGNRLILTCDGTEHRYITALDKTTGRPLWKTGRSNAPQMEGKVGDLKKAYHTPHVIQVGDHEELISMGAFRVSGFNPATGQELWWIDLPGFSNVTRPVYGHGLLYMATGFMKPEFWAIRPGGRGDVTQTHVVWKVTRQAPQKPSPVLAGDLVFMVADNGIMTCMDARNGTVHWQERVGGEFSASPLLVGDRIYLFDQEGKVSVVQASKSFTKLAEAQLGDGFMASPAVSGDAFFLRSRTHLYRVEQGARLGFQ